MFRAKIAGRRQTRIAMADGLHQNGLITQWLAIPMLKNKPLADAPAFLAWALWLAVIF
jgi:hypothetical protein